MKFKRLLAVLLAVMFCFSVCLSVSAEEITGGVNGDINEDGFTNSLDLTVVTKALLKVEDIDKFDVNYDKSSDIRDLVALKNSISGHSQYADNDFDVSNL